MRALVLACLTLVIGGTSPGWSQDPSLSIPPPILTIDQDRLFTETLPGLSISQEVEARATSLADENEAIEKELTLEELELTQLRETLSTEDFKARADEFDAKVQRIRAEQDQKARAINEAGEEARQRFFNDIAVHISDIVRERGALIVLDRRDVFLSADRIDITDDAIARVNASSAD